MDDALQHDCVPLAAAPTLTRSLAASVASVVATGGAPVTDDALGTECGPLTFLPTGSQWTPETPGTTNAGFLNAIFIGLMADERPVALSIKGAIAASTSWPTGIGWTPGVETSDASLNWYFTLSTFSRDGGTYRRRKAQWRRAFGVMLDDIGSKAAPRERLDACPPSYLIETSSGNFQAGYLFAEPCTELARVEALQEALIKAGLCDPGAKGPSTRMGRLPVGANGKYLPPQPCRLVEWHPERRYMIEQITDLLELEYLVPGGTRKKARTRDKAAAIDCNAEADVYRPRPAENAVLAALRQRGHYKQPLGSGRHDITCPWVHEHTGAMDHGTAYFEPSDLYPVGGFKCQHSHGDTKRIGALLDYLGVTFTAAKNKPAILVAAGELHRVVDAAERELAAAGRHYQRGGLIVSVVTDPGTGETRIQPTSANGLMRALSSCVTWERFDARTHDFVLTDPPAKHVNVLFDGETYAHLPVLRGIARQPYLRPDGSLMSLAGFDAATGVFGAFDERAFNIPANPDKGVAIRALGELLALVGEFAFAAPHDKAAALAAMLTAAIRPALAAAPMFHIKAPQIASGKSYLSGLIAAFAGPAKPSAYAFPTNEEECAKLLLSALMASPPVVVFDNLTTDLTAFKSLCSALTEEFIAGRVLGVSKTATVPTTTLFLSSGNNVDAVRDMTRRVLTISLDPACETPATRNFSGDPLSLVQRDRERFVSLALTIVRAHVIATRPEHSLKPLASYGAWTGLVRAALVWLGQPDPATAVFTRMAEDPDRETLGRMLLAWNAAFGSSPTAVRDALRLTQNFGGGATRAELSEVFRDVAELKGEINRNRLGRWIGRHQGRIVHGLKFKRDTPAGGSERWSVRGVSGVSELSGDATGRPAQSVSATTCAIADSSTEVFS